MPLFFPPAEQATLGALRQADPGASFFWALRERVARRAATPGLADGGEPGTAWWHSAAELLSDAAYLVAAAPEPAISAWLRQTALAVARLDEHAWVGPPFRDHASQPLRGSLETAHLSWSLALVLDLAADAFTAAETAELAAVLRQRALPLCRQGLATQSTLNNWSAVLTAGLAVPAAVLHDRAAMAEAVAAYRLAAQAFQADGSYGESLQYGNYAALHLMLAWEALVRREPTLAAELPLLPHGRFVRWAAASHLYCKAAGGDWGGLPRPRAANFGDSAALFRPSADLLLHVAVRLREIEPDTAGLARWLFDKLHAAVPRQGPCTRASFGFVNHFGFLTLALLEAAPPPRAPAAAGLPELVAFENGDVLARDAWDGATVLAVRAGADALACSGHRHADQNAFILTHRQERLLADPGHSCYRGLIHELEVDAATHNTCTFRREPPGFGLPAADKSHLLNQHAPARRLLAPTGGIIPPVSSGGRRLLSARLDGVSAIVSDAAGAYPDEVREFVRVWLLAGAHALFVIDFIATAEPLLTTWHWVFNNRDGDLDLRQVPPDRLVVRRGAAGLKLFHVGPAAIAGTRHTYMHDAYHPEPAQLGEGRSGSGTVVDFRELRPETRRHAIHVIALDSAGGVPRWHLKTKPGGVALESPVECWSLFVDPAARAIRLQRGNDGGWRLRGGDSPWSFERC